MNYESRRHKSSALARTISAFAHALSAVGIFLLIPLLAQHVRPYIFSYFSETFSQDVSLWSSWGFLIVLAVCIFFGSSALIQTVVQLIVNIFRS